MKYDLELGYQTSRDDRVKVITTFDNKLATITLEINEKVYVLSFGDILELKEMLSVSLEHKMNLLKMKE